MKKKTFQSQLIRSFFLIVCAVVLLVSAFLLISQIRSNRDQVQNDLMSSAELISSQFGFVVKNMSFISTYTLSNQNFTNNMMLLMYDDLPDSKYLAAYNTVQSALINYSVVSSIYRMMFFNEKGYIATSDQYNIHHNAYERIPPEELAEIDWLHSVQNNYGQTVLLPVQQRTFQDEPEDTLMLVRAVRNPGVITGYLIVDVPMREVEDILQLGTDYDQTLLIVNKDGEILYSNGPLPQAAEGEFLPQGVNWDKEGYLSASVTDSAQKLTTILLAPKSALINGLMRQIGLYLSEAVLLLVIAIGMILFVSKRLTQPLRMLSEQMNSTDLASLQNDTDYSDYYKYAETEALYHAYHDMGERLKTLIEREITWKTQQAEQRLRILQSQINPHFMYNTLNMIGIMGYESGNRKIFDACRDFSDLMRYSISDKYGNDSTVGEEIAYLKSYLSLMQMRFEKMCDFEIQLDPAIAAERIPRLTLQPFVENIFEHAYDGHTATVHIAVCARAEGERWVITVRDDGCGMQAGALDALKREIADYLSETQQLHPVERGGGIGMKNALSRLKLFYPDTFTYDIEACSPGFGIMLCGSRKEMSHD